MKIESKGDWAPGTLGTALTDSSGPALTTMSPIAFNVCSDDPTVRSAMSGTVASFSTSAI